MVKIEVRTYKNKSPIGTHPDKIAYDDESDRRWLGKHCFWAMHDGRKVSTFPLPA